MKKRWPVIVTLILLISAFLLLAHREWLAGMKEGEPSQAGPEETIWRMSDATREGNARAYLDCFSGQLQQNLGQTAAEMGEARFSEYLKQLNREVTGIAVSSLEPSFVQSGAQEAERRVEFVFRGKSEMQKHHFKLVNSKWRIDRVDDAEQLKVLIPYGTPVGEIVQKGARR